MKIDLNLFKTAFGIQREKSDLIYNGFGFRHHENVTKYYLHPDNQSKMAQTSVAQPIAEGIVMFAEFLKSYYAHKPQGKLLYKKADNDFVISFGIGDDWHNAGVFDNAIATYRARLKKHGITLCAYDADGNAIESCDENNTQGENFVLKTQKSQDEILLEHYKICAAFVVLAAKDFLVDDNIQSDVYELLNKNDAENFVILCEDFYQRHKYANYGITYADIKTLKTDDYECFELDGDMSEKNQSIDIQKFPLDEFSDEQKILIPNLSEEFRLDNSLVSVCNAVSSGDARSLLLHGPAGTGKTMSCKLICMATGLPVMETVNCTENLDEFVLGKYIPEGDKIIFKESFVTKAIRDGGAVVFEEINFAKPQYLAFLNSLLDDNGFVRLDNGEVVRRNKNFRFFATMNVGYFGTKQLNQALYNRFNAIIEIAQLSDKAVERMLIFRVPECKPYVQKIINIYHKIKKKIETEELDIVISPRNLENWARMAKFEGYPLAAEKTIIPIAKCDRMLEKTFRSIINVYKWD